MSEILSAQSNDELSMSASRFATHLERSGLLAPVAENKPTRTKTCIRETRTSAFDGFAARCAQPTFARFPQLLYGLAYVRRMRRTLPFIDTIEAVQSWKRSLISIGSIDRAIKLSSEFHAATPYLFTRLDACMFRSLFLLKFLIMRGVAADWVFGVRLCPFKAHCWIERDGVILNDHLDTILEYRRILEV